MIAFLDGTLAGKTLASAFVNVGGVGFEVGMSQAGLAKLPATGEHVTVHTYLQVRDDGMSLFGFLSLEEKALFEKLITVSGVGPKVALAALSSYAPSQLADLIAAQDVAAVQRIPGVGKKTASRIILELKAVNFVDKSHRRQLFNYMHLTHTEYGMLINFGGDSLFSEWYRRSPMTGEIDKIKLL